MRSFASHLMGRVITLFVTIAFLLCHAGCTSKILPSAPPADLQLCLRTRKIVVVPGQVHIEGKTDLYSDGKWAGVGKGLGRGALFGLGLGAEDAFEQPSSEGATLAFILLTPVFVVVGGTVGAIWGGIKGTPRKVSSALKSCVEETLAGLEPSQVLARNVAEEAEKSAWLDIEYMALNEPIGESSAMKNNMRSLLGRDFGSMLEIVVSSIALKGDGGKDPNLCWHLRAHARLVGLEGTSSAFVKNFEYFSLPHRYSTLAKHGMVEFRAELDIAFKVLARIMVSRLFLENRIGLDFGADWPGNKKETACCWHCPRSPQLDYSFPTASLQYPTVSTLKPELEWEPFPDEKDQQFIRDKAIGEISAVRYDVKLWQVDDGLPGKEVYQRYGLTNNSHRLEEPLKPESFYYWSVRACFQCNGQRACTPWAFSGMPNTSCAIRPIPAPNFYRFKTPGPPFPPDMIDTGKEESLKN
jgi:hypothetical protein